MGDGLNLKVKDKVKFKIGNEVLYGIVTSIGSSGRVARVRVIKQGRRCYHEWLRVKDIVIDNYEEMKVDRKLSCLNYECSFCEKDSCTYGGLMYERPCYEDSGYFEDNED